MSEQTETYEVTCPACEGDGNDRCPIVVEVICRLCDGAGVVQSPYPPTNHAA